MLDPMFVIPSNKPMPGWQKAVLAAGALSAAVIVGVALAPVAPITVGMAGSILAKHRWK